MRYSTDLRPSSDRAGETWQGVGGSPLRIEARLLASAAGGAPIVPIGPADPPCADVVDWIRALGRDHITEVYPEARQPACCCVYSRTLHVADCRFAVDAESATPGYHPNPHPEKKMREGVYQIGDDGVLLLPAWAQHFPSATGCDVFQPAHTD